MSGYIRKHCYSTSKFFHKLFEWLSSYILIPDSALKIVWDTFILLLLIVNIFYIPIKIAFEN